MKKCVKCGIEKEESLFTFSSYSLSLGSYCKPCKSDYNRQATITGHSSWRAMLNRCTNPKQQAYKRYGAKGIKVLYPDFKTFLADVGPKPGPGYSIDRIDPAGNYAPGNCRWLTIAENTRRAQLKKAA